MCSRKIWAELITNCILTIDYYLFGYKHCDNLLFDIAPSFVLQSSAKMCQNTTSVLTFIYKYLRYMCKNYIDDFGGAETRDQSAAAF